jgi:uncharacterized protein YndB with AHSA1/START domain
MSTKTANSVTTTDRIEKQVILRAPRSRVWRALADAEEFGRWFGCRFAGSFTPGARVPGTIVDPPGMEHIEWDLLVERMEPEQVFSFRWHPGADGPSSPDEPRTLVTFTLEDVPEGTRLTLVESGFDRLPPERRARAFLDNEKGWGGQMDRIARHVESG